MGHDAETAEPGHVGDHTGGVAAERIRRLRQPEGQVVTAVRADLDRVEEEQAGPVGCGLRRARAVAVVRQHDEVQPGAARGGRYLVGRPAAVGPGAVDMNGSAHHRDRVAGRRRVEVRVGAGRSRRNQEPERAPERQRRQREAAQARPGAAGEGNQRPAAERRPAALSVRSHVNSGSLRPKCPNAAVLR